MRRLSASVLLLLCAVLASGCGLVEDVVSPKAQELGSLKTLTSKNFRVELPCIPAESTQDTAIQGLVEPVPMKMWTCEGQDVGYIVATVKLPPGVRGNLAGAAQGAADALENGKVVKNAKTSYAGLPARDVRIESTWKGTPGTMFGRVLVHDRVLYQVQGIVVGKHTTKPPELYRDVLKSLSFK
jgi:hypothetical protein